MPDKKSFKFINDHYIKYLCKKEKKLLTLRAHALYNNRLKVG